MPNLPPSDPYSAAVCRCCQMGRGAKPAPAQGEVIVLCDMHMAIAEVIGNGIVGSQAAIDASWFAWHYFKERPVVIEPTPYQQSA